MRRCFVTAGGTRQVHYRRHGSGPPLVLLHESPQTSAGFVPLMEALGSLFTTIALDTAGFGLSDPLAVERPEIVDYAEATAAAIEALGLGPVPVYGNHTGSLIALELARRVPDLVAVAILDGLPMFLEEAPDLAAHYAPPFTPAFDGSHLLLAWARHRDGFVYFPWYRRDAEHRLDLPMPAPAALQQRLLDGLRVGARYGISFQAAFRYRPLEALPEARAPLALVCRTDDLQASRQSRVPARYASEVLPRERWLARIVEVALAHSLQAGAPPEPSATHIPGRITRAYVDTSAGQLLVRRTDPSGDGGTGRRPVVLVHGSPGGARPLEPLLMALGELGPAWAIDLPGYGDSDKRLGRSATVGDFARILGDALDALGLSDGDLYSTGTGAVIAVELAVARPDLVHALALDSVAPTDGAIPSDQHEQQFVSLEPTLDGAHLVRAWNMTVDASRWSPWTERVPAARVDLDLTPQALQNRTFDLLLTGSAYPLAARAAMVYPLRQRLSLVSAPTLVTGGPAERKLPEGATHRAAALRDWFATAC